MDSQMFKWSVFTTKSVVISRKRKLVMEDGKRSILTSVQIPKEYMVRFTDLNRHSLEHSKNGLQIKTSPEGISTFDRVE